MGFKASAARLVVVTVVLPRVFRGFEGGTVFNTLNFSISPLDLSNQTGVRITISTLPLPKRFVDRIHPTSPTATSPHARQGQKLQSQ